MTDQIKLVLSYPHNFPHIKWGKDIPIPHEKREKTMPLKTQLFRSRSAVSRESWAMICPTTDSGNMSMSLLSLSESGEATFETAMGTMGKIIKNQWIERHHSVRHT